jgi:hypothetical protein
MRLTTSREAMVVAPKEATEEEEPEEEDEEEEAVGGRLDAANAAIGRSGLVSVSSSLWMEQKQANPPSKS